MSSSTSLPPTLLVILLTLALFLHLNPTMFAAFDTSITTSATKNTTGHITLSTDTNNHINVSNKTRRRLSSSTTTRAAATTWVQTLHEHSNGVTSQGGQDGILEEIFRHIAPRTKRFVEIGFNYAQGETDLTKLLIGTNTYNLERQYGWSGYRFDVSVSMPSISVYKELMTADNVNSILYDKYDLHGKGGIDYLSIDIDSVDLWVLKSVLDYNHKHHNNDNDKLPRVISVEFNSNFDWHQAVTVDQQWRPWMGDVVYGASARALYNVVLNNGLYSIVHLEKYMDVFLVRNDLLKLAGGRPWSLDELQHAYPLPIWLHGWPRVYHRNDESEGRIIVKDGENLKRFIDFDEWNESNGRDIQKARSKASDIVKQVKRRRELDGIQQQT